jgi:osmoprotectant transport system permease protein
VSIALPISLRYGFGLGFWPTAVALVALAIPPIFTNTHAGITSIDPSVVDAARGMGMRGSQVLWRVEAPNAMPLMLTGLRISAVQVVATATLGAFVGFGGLGAFINEGFRQLDDGKLLTGAVLVAMLAIATELLFGVGQRLLTPWLRRKGHP